MKQKICSEKGCKKRVKARNVCNTCRSRKSRQADPVRYAYSNLKGNAQRRGKEFTLTLEQFREFCIKTDYMRGKGRTSESYSIDRMENDKGYTEDNIRIMTFGDNARKGAKSLEYDWMTRTATVITQRKEVYIDQPF